MNYPNRHILCIDLKSFFATAECLERNLDPFSTPLVVANPKQGNGAITLAVTPYLKAKGVKGRSRLYEIPKHIKYKIVPPRMSLYSKKSTEVVDVYLSFVAEEDLYVYSIDEAFLDVTNYLKMYDKTDHDLAKTILNTITKKTGLFANCGIGPNMLLAKIAMDVEAKNFKDGIAKWDYEDIPNKLWPITPISKMWGIGQRMEIKLNHLGINTIFDLAHYNQEKLTNKFGIMGKELWNHANGIDLRTISDWKKQSKEQSYSHSQVLFKDYNANNIALIISEMVDVIAARLRANKKQCGSVGLEIGYSKIIGGSFFHIMKLSTPTDLEKNIYDVCMSIFEKSYEDLPIRKVSITAGRLQNKDAVQLNIFQDYEKITVEEQISDTIDEIKNKFGKNSLIKASSLLPDSTAIERNTKKGGHPL